MRLLQEEDRVVVMRFGHDFDQQCMQMDEVKLGIKFMMTLSAMLRQGLGTRNCLHCADLGRGS